MEIEELSCIKDLEEFANTLSAKQRLEVYGIASRFYHVGAAGRYVSTALNALEGKNSEEDKHREYVAYFARKLEEASRKR